MLTKLYACKPPIATPTCAVRETDALQRTPTRTYSPTTYRNNCRWVTQAHVCVSLSVPTSTHRALFSSLRRCTTATTTP